MACTSRAQAVGDDHGLPEGFIFVWAFGVYMCGLWPEGTRVERIHGHSMPARDRWWLFSSMLMLKLRARKTQSWCRQCGGVVGRRLPRGTMRRGGHHPEEVPWW